MSDLVDHISNFITHVRLNDVGIYNEFSLQHELGIYLRGQIDGLKVQFERNVKYFSQSGNKFTKSEIDISVHSGDRTDLRYAVELKYPRNGQYPEQMFNFCKDIAFCEQLKKAGFSRTGLLILADSCPYYSGNRIDGIYGFFRAGQILTGTIQKPTGNRANDVKVEGNYVVSWNDLNEKTKYAFIEAAL